MEKSQALEIKEPKDEFQTNWDGRLMRKYQEFWLPEAFFKAVTNFQRNFQAKDSDIILATLPKSGTTWLKALVFTIINRNNFSIHESPLLASNPHSLVPFVDINLYQLEQEIPILDDIMPSSPRLLSNHIPYQAYPPSVVQSKCRIIYICRNPLDQFVSYRHFALENVGYNGGKALTLNESFDLFCKGIHTFGPFWEHMLGYWNVSLENPKKVLFLKYEDLKVDTISCVKKIAQFSGFPFSKDEESKGLVQEIINLCSFESLKNLEVNINGTEMPIKDVVLKYSSFFRKGQVGDWVNHNITPSMADRINNIMKEKFGESGLTFDNYCRPNMVGGVSIGHCGP